MVDRLPTRPGPQFREVATACIQSIITLEEQLIAAVAVEVGAGRDLPELSCRFGTQSLVALGVEDHDLFAEVEADFPAALALEIGKVERRALDGRTTNVPAARDPAGGAIAAIERGRLGDRRGAFS